MNVVLGVLVGIVVLVIECVVVLGLAKILSHFMATRSRRVTWKIVVFTLSGALTGTCAILSFTGAAIEPTHLVRNLLTGTFWTIMFGNAVVLVTKQLRP